MPAQILRRPRVGYLAWGDFLCLRRQQPGRESAVITLATLLHRCCHHAGLEVELDFLQSLLKHLTIGTFLLLFQSPHRDFTALTGFVILPEMLLNTHLLHHLLTLPQTKAACHTTHWSPLVGSGVGRTRALPLRATRCQSPRHGRVALTHLNVPRVPHVRV